MDRNQRFNQIKCRIKKIADIPPDLELTQQQIKQRNQQRAKRNKKSIFNARQTIPQAPNNRQQEKVDSLKNNQHSNHQINTKQIPSLLEKKSMSESNSAINITNPFGKFNRFDNLKREQLPEINIIPTQNEQNSFDKPFKNLETKMKEYNSVTKPLRQGFKSNDSIQVKQIFTEPIVNKDWQKPKFEPIQYRQKKIEKSQIIYANKQESLFNMQKNNDLSQKQNLFGNYSNKTNLFQQPKETKAELKTQTSFNTQPNSDLSQKPSLFGNNINKTNLFQQPKEVKVELKTQNVFNTQPNSGLSQKTTLFQQPKETKAELKTQTVFNTQQNSDLSQKTSIFSNNINKTNLFQQPNKNELKPLTPFNTQITLDLSQKTSLFGNNINKTNLFQQSKETKAELKSQNLFNTQQNSDLSQRSKLFGDNNNKTNLFQEPKETKAELKTQNLFNTQPNSDLSQKPSLFGNNINKTNLFQQPKQPKAELKTQTPFNVDVSDKANIIGNVGKLNKIGVGQQFKSTKNQTPLINKGDSLQSYIVGPGGQKVQLRTSNLFNQKSTSAFGLNNSKAIEKPGNLFSNNNPKPSDIFKSNNSGGLFASTSSNSNNLQSQAQPNIFAKPSSNSVSLFGPPIITNVPATQGLFTNMQSTLFNKNGNGDNSEQQNEQDDDNEPIQADDDNNIIRADPTFNYLKTSIHFKELALKFRIGVKDTLQNINISIQNFDDSQDYYIYGRMPNKCIAFCGKIIPNTTEFRILNNSKENIEVKKLLLTGQNIKKAEIVLIKIKFKEISIGQKFIKELEKCLKGQKIQ